MRTFAASCRVPNGGFESRFLASAERRGKTEFAKTLSRLTANLSATVSSLAAVVLQGLADQGSVKLGYSYFTVRKQYSCPVQAASIRVERSPAHRNDNV